MGIWTLPTRCYFDTQLLDHKQTIAKGRADSKPLLADTQIMVYVATTLAVIQQCAIRASFADVQTTFQSNTLREATLPFKPGTQGLNFEVVEGVAVAVSTVDDQSIVEHHRYVTEHTNTHSHGSPQTTPT